MKALLGASGAHKCEMANLGLPVAPGFCITPKCLQSGAGNEGPPLTDAARNDIKLALGELEDASEQRFGNLVDPLLLSIEGDLKLPMQGFRGTISNIGLNDAIVEAWTAHASPHFVWDSYRRLICQFARAVRRLDMEPFENALAEVKGRLNAQCQLGREHADCHIPTSELRSLVATYKELFEEQTGEAFPQEPERQLWEAVHAASCSWDPRQESNAAAVTVQSTIFSNFDFRSAVGITLTSGTEDDDGSADGSFVPEIRGKWLMNAQSEDMTSDRTPQEVTQDASCQWAARHGIEESQRVDEFPSLEEAMPGIFAKLLRWQDIAETHFSDLRGLEFAIHQGRLWILQTHTDKHALRELLFNGEKVELELEPNSPCRSVNEPEHEPWPEFGVPGQDLRSEETSDANQLELTADRLEAFQDEALAQVSDASLLSVFEQTPRKVEKGLAHQATFRSPSAMMWRALRRFGSSGQNQSPAFHASEAVAASTWALATPCGLPLWQTALAGGAASVACRGLGMSIERLPAAAQMRTVGGYSSLVRAFCLQQGLRSFVATSMSAGGPVRAAPFGMVCCTLYTNLLYATPADNSALVRLGCAASAVFSAQVVTEAAASAGKLWFPRFGTLVPTMAIEMATIDLVKNHLVGADVNARGQNANPVVLIASGAVAGTVAQTVMHPLKALCRMEGVQAVAASGGGTVALRATAMEGAAAVFAGLGPACFRSMPIVAMNSLVRVGLTTHFLNLTSNAP